MVAPMSDMLYYHNFANDVMLIFNVKQVFIKYMGRGKGIVRYSSLKSVMVNYQTVLLLVHEIRGGQNAFYCPERGPTEVMFFEKLHISSL